MAFSLLLIGLTSYDTRCLMSKLRNVRRTISTEWTGLYPSVNAVTHQRCWPCVQVRGPKHTRASNLDLFTCLPADAALTLDVYGNGHSRPREWYGIAFHVRRCRPTVSQKEILSFKTAITSYTPKLASQGLNAVRDADVDAEAGKGLKNLNRESGLGP